MKRTVRGAGRVLAGIAVLGGVVAADGAGTWPPVTPGTLGLDPADHVYDTGVAALTSLYAGPTSCLIPGDFDRDGFPDVVNVNHGGAQVLLSRGVTGGHLSFEMAQEFRAEYSFRGGAIDLDGDLDLDLVIGDVRHVIVGVNDGTGHFTVTTPVTHGFLQPTVAVPFRARTDAGSEPRIVVGPSSDGVAADLLGANAPRPAAYVLRPDGAGGWTVLQQLDAINLDDVAAGDVDGDGVTDLLTANRSGVATPFAHLWLGTGGGAAYAATEIAQFAGYPYRFSYVPTIAPDGDLALGSWHMVRVWDRASGTTFGSPTDVNMDPGGAGGWPSGEVFATAFADIDGDGSADLVTLGRSTPVQVVRLTGDANHPANRFAGSALGGSGRDLVVLDWDCDVNGAPDVLEGRSDGLWLHRNVNGGAAGTPDVPPGPTLGDLLRTAWRDLVTILDPFAADPFEDDAPWQPEWVPDDPYFDAARYDAAHALAELAAIDPDWITDDVIAGTTNEEKVATLRSCHARVLAAWNALDPDTLGTTVPADLAAIAAIRARLFDALAAIVDEAVGLGAAPTFPAKRAAASPRKVLRSALRARNEMTSLVSAARSVRDARRAERLQRTAARLGQRTLVRLGRYWSLVESRGAAG